MNSLKVSISECTYNFSLNLFRRFTARFLLHSCGQTVIPNGFSPIKPDTLSSVIVAIIFITKNMNSPFCFGKWIYGKLYYNRLAMIPTPRHVSIPATLSLYYMKLLGGILLQLSKCPRGLINGRAAIFGALVQS